MKPKLLAFVALAQGLLAKNEAALSVIGKTDQFEGENAKEMGVAAETLKENRLRITETIAAANEALTLVDGEVKAAAEALLPDLITAKIAAGEYIAKADAETAVAAAKLQGKQDAEAAFAQVAAENAALLVCRNEISTLHGAEVAASLSNDSLKGDDAAFAAFKTELARRVTELSAIGVTAAAKKTAFADIACNIPFSADGNTAFDARLVTIKELVGPGGYSQAAASSATTQVPGSGQPPAMGTGGQPPAKTDDTEKLPTGF